ncbi:MFS transporter [Maricurvus nonylphenolicus]|uniref:spinster family MFS transporter n=1 Tax=Maricurvus nonylphenolicus TaxID=1008307 RepID=UPI0036F29F88
MSTVENLASDNGPIAEPGSFSYDKPAYRHFVLLMLALVYMFNFVDRQLLVILQESIKADMGFSDTQLGMMSGFAFACLYVICGIPIARLADRSNRRNVIAASLAIWSLMTALCGMAQSFVQMLLARMGVAVGEAGGTPPALSMISDMYPEKSRATAMSVYTSGVYLGVFVGFVLGGWLGQVYGWRTAFIAVGLPGILFALLLCFLVKEPARYRFGKPAVETDKPHGSLWGTIRDLWHTTSFRYIALGGGMASFASYGMGNWLPSYFLRAFETSMGEVGTWLGLASGLGGIIGTIGGGLLADKLILRDRRWYVWLPATVIFCSGGFTFIILTTEHLYLALTLSVVSTAIFSSWLPAILALSHGLVSTATRAQATAVLYFVINIIGMGMGPAAVGFLSDMLAMPEGGQSLRYAMFTAAIFGGSLAAYFFVCASRTVIRDMDNVPA